MPVSPVAQASCCSNLLPLLGIVVALSLVFKFKGSCMATVTVQHPIMPTEFWNAISVELLLVITLGCTGVFLTALGKRFLVGLFR